MTSKALLCLAIAGFSTLAVAGDEGLGPHHSSVSMSTQAGESGITAYGAFRRFMHMADFGTKVIVGDIKSTPSLYGIGALTDLKGEITVVGGDPVVSLGSDWQHRLSAQEASSSGASLLVTVKVPTWYEVRIDQLVKDADVEAYVLNQAKRAGVVISSSFPFVVKGMVGPFKAHVLDGANPEFKGHGSQVRMAQQVDEQSDGLKGTVVGFYAAPNDVGVITHPGERIHAHFVADGNARTSHLDSLSLTKGSTLLLPVSE
jgi:alpha-acetolactate decarboxylase